MPLAVPVTLIANPVAGRGRSGRVLELARRFLDDQGVAVTLRLTERPGHATEIAAATPADASVLALGGDGTVHEVAAACVGSDRILGVVPAGSGDDFVHALGFDGTPEDALRRIVAGRVRTVDTGWADGEIFINALGIGFDAEVAWQMEATPRFLKGAAAYFVAVLAALRRLRCPEVRIEIDGREVYAGPSLLVTTQNGPRTGGSFPLAPDARPDDGWLDVVVAEGFSRSGALAMLPRLLAGRHLSHPRVHAFRGRRISLRWQEPRRSHLEGQLGAPRRNFDIELRPGSLRVYA